MNPTHQLDNLTLDHQLCFIDENANDFTLKHEITFNLLDYVYQKPPNSVCHDTEPKYHSNFFMLSTITPLNLPFKYTLRK